ncbi:cytochrome p450, partial [Colletotrichum musicola]
MRKFFNLDNLRAEAPAMRIRKKENMTTIAFVALAIGALVLAREFWLWLRLSHVPGPFRHALTGFSMARTALKGSIHEHYMELHEKYGPLVRIGPNTVMFSDPETLKQIAA